METVNIIKVTPEMAEGWLQNNSTNRKTSLRIIERYASDMSENKWNFTGDSIKFTTNGKLLDGQHRLLAIIKSNKPQKLLIISKLKDEIFYDLDKGRKRTFADILHINNPELKYLNSIASAVRFLYAYYSFTDDVSFKTKTTTVKDFKLLNQYFIENKEAIMSSLNFVVGISSEDTFITKTVLVFIHFIFSRIDKETADDFVSSLMTGENLKAQSPIYSLREKLIEFRYKKVSLSPELSIIYCINVWNALQSGTRIKLKPTMEMGKAIG